MFKAKRRSESDFNCKWEEDKSLENEFNKIFEDADFYVVRHWFLKCAAAPLDSMFYEKDGVEKYINKSVSGGDALEIWSILQDRSVYISGKMPDMNGLIPVSGCAY